MSHEESLSVRDLAMVDQAQASIAEMADRATREGPRCCSHPLCVGPELSGELMGVMLHGPTLTLTMLCAALRILGTMREEQRRREAT